MKLQTKIPLQPERHQIDYSSKVLLIGSCFTENIGGQLTFHKFQNLQNPFGIVFHPVAIEKLVTRAINEDFFIEEDLFFHNEQWRCFEVHSLLSHSDKDAFLKLLNTKLKQLLDYLLSASHIIFTYGTAWVYRYIETDAIVANCHKIPQKKFLKELLTVDEVSATTDNTITLIRDVNPNVSIVYTVSPVRHLKDGFVENTRSKAHLIAGIHEVSESHKKNHYFPSFELMMDELRDYRFYTEDMLHPSKIAVAIIWERFNHVWIASETRALQSEIASIQSGLKHRSFNPESDSHKEFQRILQEKIKSLQKLLPHVSF